ncbi:GGDEF domain-containing protein [Sinorhizobium meliloti]|uniref:GGDEF domain-containing phosphodiesterase n=1 Tax=Rhizobium meliloti TaxID=382 RepID=UPI000FDA2256|nr:GGDEF domain-containing phosphodiesterase [Sinorhizobium meliloti]RVM24837.1 GGDEF domain-containing protein [Sinorhizobium meliloti]
MTLGKRALILIFPVVLAGYLLAALSVHLAQSRSIRALEHAKLSQRLEHAASVFQNEVRRSRGALNALLSGNALRQYVAETDKKYRANALGVRLQESLTSLSDDPAGFISLAVFNSKLEAEYYFENSWDPFAEIDPAQLDLARQLLNGSKLGDWSYVDSAGDRPRVVYSLFVDPVTFGRPAPSNKANALLMQVAVQPDRFLRLQAPLKREYGAEIVLQPWPLAVTDDLSASVPLGPALHATLTVSDAHFEAQMLRQKVLLALGALAMSLFSIWLIIVLIRRFITGPIATLDTNVMAVMAGAREEIAEVDEAGEIGRLTRNIREMHRQSLQSLQLVQRSSWTDTLTGISNRGRFNMPGDGAVQEICGAILALFSDGFELSGKRYPVTASIGVAACPDDASSVAELISNADAAMYQAKTAGKNRSARFSRALNDKRTRQRQIQDELRSLDPDEQFHLVYMPIVDPGGKVTGCEALLRWHSPVLGHVTPDEFVPIAESSGLFTKIDWWVIDKAMSDCHQLKALFGPDTVLAINISSAELHSKSINEHFSDCLTRHGLEARSIDIELTETFAVQISDQLRLNMEELRSKGFRLSIDDFGAGYTSVQQIIDYAADTIKLDRALVSNLAASRSLAVLKAVVALCHAKEMTVVGEGVDTPEKLAMLTAAGCDRFQGYLISKPLPLAELAIWALSRVALAADKPADGDVWPVAASRR